MYREKCHCRGRLTTAVQRLWGRQVAHLLFVSKLNVDTSPKSAVACCSAMAPACPGRAGPQPCHTCNTPKTAGRPLRDSVGRVGPNVLRFGPALCVPFQTSPRLTAVAADLSLRPCVCFCLIHSSKACRSHSSRGKPPSTLSPQGATWGPTSWVGRDS